MSVRSTSPRTATQVRTTIRVYVLGSLFVVLVSATSWATTGNASASFGMVPVTAVFLALAGQARKELAALEAAGESVRH